MSASDGCSPAGGKAQHTVLAHQGDVRSGGRWLRPVPARPARDGPGPVFRVVRVVAALSFGLVSERTGDEGRCQQDACEA